MELRNDLDLLLLKPVLTGDFPINTPISHNLAQLAATVSDV